jgi:predicted LPLAT superfamily acyltransferase
MAELITQPHFHTPGETALRAYTPGDDFYEQLILTHRDLSDDQSRLVNARLILLLANHIGDLNVLRQALAAARQGVAPQANTP